MTNCTYNTPLYISLLSLHNCDAKMPNFTFYTCGGCKQQTDGKIFFFFLNLDNL